MLILYGISRSFFMPTCTHTSGVGRGGLTGLEPPPFVLQLQLSLNHRDLSIYSAIYFTQSILHYTVTRMMSFNGNVGRVILLMRMLIAEEK